MRITAASRTGAAGQQLGRDDLRPAAGATMLRLSVRRRGSDDGGAVDFDAASVKDRRNS